MSIDDVLARARTAASEGIASEVASFRRTGAAAFNGTKLRIVPHPDQGKYVLEVVHKGDRIHSLATTREKVVEMAEHLIGMPHLVGHFVKEMKGSSVTPISSGASATGKKVRAKSIVFVSAEGYNKEKDPFLKKPYKDFAHANKAVREMAYYRTEGGGYDKTNFQITWDNGDTYEGRIDVDHNMRTEQRPLTNHVVSHLKFLAGTHPKPKHVKTEEEWQQHMARNSPEHKAEAIAMLRDFDLGQSETVYEPRQPSGPTMSQQHEAESKRKDQDEKAAHVAKFSKYPPAVTDRDEAIAKIKAALQKRSGKMWSVTGGKGTGWGWIKISAPPKRLVENYYMSDADQAELRKLLDLDRQSLHQGVSIPAGSVHRTEYVDRAEGRDPRGIGQQYWD